MSIASKSTRMGSSGRSARDCASPEDPHELILEKAMSNFDERSDKLQKLLKVDKRYNTMMASVKLQQSDVDVMLVPGVAMTGADGHKKNGGSISLNQSGINRRAQATIVPFLSMKKVPQTDYQTIQTQQIGVNQKMHKTQSEVQFANKDHFITANSVKENQPVKSSRVNSSSQRSYGKSIDRINLATGLQTQSVSELMIDQDLLKSNRQFSNSKAESVLGAHTGANRQIQSARRLPSQSFGSARNILTSAVPSLVQRIPPNRIQSARRIVQPRVTIKSLSASKV